MNKLEREQYGVEQRAKVVSCLGKHSGNVSAVARELGCSRKNVRYHLRKAGAGLKPLAGGKKHARAKRSALPLRGDVKRYILTSAQNNTYIHKDFWENVLAMASHYDAQIMVGTFSYNQNNFGKLAVKDGTKKPYEHELWFDPAIA